MTGDTGMRATVTLEQRVADLANLIGRLARDPGGTSMRENVTEETPNLFWADDGWLVDLREYRGYPIYGEGAWTLRRDNAGIGYRGARFNGDA